MCARNWTVYRKNVDMSIGQPQSQMKHPQDELLDILGLYVLSQTTTNDILAEHAWNNALEKAEGLGLTIEDAIYNLEYFRPYLIENSN